MTNATIAGGLGLTPGVWHGTGNMYVGYRNNSTGSIILNGNMTSMDITGEMYVGLQDNGQGSITNWGNNASSLLVTGSVYVGANSTSSASAAVGVLDLGTGATDITAGSLRVGDYGTGTVTGVGDVTVNANGGYLLVSRSDANRTGFARWFFFSSERGMQADRPKLTIGYTVDDIE